MPLKGISTGLVNTDLYKPIVGECGEIPTTPGRPQPWRRKVCLSTTTPQAPNPKRSQAPSSHPAVEPPPAWSPTGGGLYRSVTATSAWGPKTKPHSPRGDCCNCEAVWSHTCSISSATVGRGRQRTQGWGPGRTLPLYPEGPGHSLRGNPPHRDPVIS